MPNDLATTRPKHLSFQLTRPSRFTLILLGLIALLLAAYACRVWWITRPLTYESQRWIASDGLDFYDVRWRMRSGVTAMIDDGTLATRQDVIAELGSGDPYFQQSDRSVYLLGHGWIPIDPWVLEVRYDKDDRIIDYKVRPT